LKAQTVLETDHTIVAMNTREPQARGHVVLFPKRHVLALHEMSSDELADIADAAAKVARASQLTNYNLLHNAGALAGQTVFHAHFHLIPKRSEGEGLQFSWNTEARFDQGQAYQSIKQALSRGD
jgi:diadenosine tetraphosphate (Ap4A) HIT family hydrolase